MEVHSNSEDDSSGKVLTLYHSLGSSYSQKVLMALYEKNLKFDSCLIDLYAGEHLEPFFIAINQKSEVPVLVDGKTTITESSKILEYLDSNYSEDSSRLMPKKKDELDRVIRMKKLLEVIPLHIMTFGAVYHSQLSVNAKITGVEKQLRLNLMKCGNSLVDSFIIKHPDHEERYKQKKKKYTEVFSSIQDINVVKEALKKVEKVLDVIEEELNTNEDNWWLCGPHFTVADILLTVLLRRIEFLGLKMWFFRDGIRSSIVKYYERVRERKSFVDTFKHDFVDDNLPGGILSYTTLFVALAMIVFAIVAACAHLKNH